MCVLDKAGKQGLGTSARFQVSDAIVAKLLEGQELAQVVADMTDGSDVRAGLGMMGVITQGHLPRAECYAHGLIFAFGPWLSDAKWWT